MIYLLNGSDESLCKNFVIVIDENPLKKSLLEFSDCAVLISIM